MTRSFALGLACALATGSAPLAGQSPHASGSPLVARPAGSVARAAEWVDAVLTHAPGASDGAVAIAGAWPHGLTND